MTKKQFVAVDDDLVADTKHERLMNNIVVADMLNCFIKENKQLKQQNKELKKQNENLLAKLKYTCDKINYSDKLREMMK